MKWITFFLIFLFMSGFVYSEMRTWTDQNGNTFRGELVNEESGKVRLKAGDGRLIVVPLNGLSDQDQAYINNNRIPKLDIQFSKQSADSKTSFLKVNVHAIYNHDITQKLDLYVVVYAKDGRVLGRQKKEHIFNGTPSRSAEIELPSLTFSDQDYGHTLVFITDDNAKIISVQATSKKIENEDEIIRQLYAAKWSQLINEQSSPGSHSNGTETDLTAFFCDYSRTPNGASGSNSLKGKSGFLRYLRDHDKKELHKKCYRNSCNKFRHPSIVFFPGLLSGDDTYQNQYRKREPYAQSSTWFMCFQGNIEYDQDITFRFISQGTGELIVIIDGRIALDTSGKIDKQTARTESVIPMAFTDNEKAYQGSWIDLYKGNVASLVVLVAPSELGYLDSILFVDVKGSTYPTNQQGTPIFPLFATEPLPEELMHCIYAGVCPERNNYPQPVVFTRTE